jgi:hypothetical protein
MPDEQLVNQPTLIGVLVIAVMALAGVITHLYRRGERRQKAIDKERAQLEADRAGWDAERAKLEAAFQEQLRHAADAYADETRQQAEDFAKTLREMRIENAASEASIRHEFIEVIEQISAGAEKSADAIRTVLQKFLDRFVGPRSRG